jgi:hypothetical protein
MEATLYPLMLALLFLIKKVSFYGVKERLEMDGNFPKEE